MNLDFSYQNKLIKDAIQTLKASKHCVLAAAPGAGKTNMAYEIIQKLLDDGTIKNALISAHGQNILLDQWLARAEKLGIKVSSILSRKNRRKPTFDKDAEISVGLPHTLIRRDIGKVDLLVVDESHHFYGASMIDELEKKIRPNFILLLTGTPAGLLSAGIPVVGITVSEMIDYGVAADPEIKLWKSAYKLKAKDYSRDMMVTGGLRAKETLETLAMLKEQVADLKEFFYRGMIVCQFRSQAALVRDWLKKEGVETLLCISDSSTGDNIKIEIEDVEDSVEKFTSEKVPTVIVVNRAILGFDYPKLRMVFDMSCSLNPDKLFQLLCRLIRRGGSKKQFIKVGSDDMALHNYHVMSYVAAMSVPEYYYEPRGGNQSPNDFSAPISRSIAARIERGEGENIRIVDLPEVPSFATFRRTEKSGEYARTTLRYVKRMLGHDSKNVSIEEYKKLALKFSHPKLFKKAHPGAYELFARRLGGVAKLYELFGLEWKAPKAPTKWTQLSAQQALLKLNPENRYELKRVNVSLYKWLLKNNIEYLNKVLPSQVKEWTKSSAFRELKKYRNRKELCNRNDSLWRYLRENHSEEFDRVMPPKPGVARTRWELLHA
jgi:superfamily II DNA or RNA helicase